MKIRWKKWLAIGMSTVFLFCGCGGSQDASEKDSEDAFPEEMYKESHEMEDAVGEQMAPQAGAPVSLGTVCIPEASGTVVYGGTAESQGVTMDASNLSDGYIMIKCDNGTDKKKKIIIQGPSGVKYTYDLNKIAEYETFGFSDGNGTYHIGIYENVEGTKYSTLFTQSVDVEMENPFAPFLCANQYVYFTPESNAVKKAEELTVNMTDELEKVQEVYHFVINHVVYDAEEAATVESGYLPDVDEVLSTQKGICFDYAALMSAMLRSQNVPTKLVVGYTGSAYHAWISTYTIKSGWVEGVIFFDGTTWKLMDPTFASSSSSSDEIMKYIGDGKNYKEKYLY